MPGKYKCPISALIITAVATLGYWNYALTTLSNGKNSKRYLQLRRQSGANSIVSTDTCGFDWLVDGLDTKIYETEKFNAKWNMDKRQAVKKDIRQITKPLIEHPMYLMDPNRYLLPVLEGGPNNQVFCLRETIFIAIKLNRTLVIPRFIKHFTDSQNVRTNPFIYPGHRVNLKTICKLISCINLEDFQSACDGQIDAVMTFRNGIETDTIELQSGMSLKRQTTSSGKVKVLYRAQPDDRRGKVYSDDILRTFNSEDRCIVYQRPLFNLLIAQGSRNGHVIRRPVMFALSGQIDDHPSNDVSQMIDITQKTQAPEYIGQLAQSFVKFLMKKRPFVAVHWRYNKGDFSRRCELVLRKMSGAPAVKIQYCLRVMNLTAEDVANAIVFNVTKSLMKLRSTTKIKDVYIAAPPSEIQFLLKVGKILRYTQRWNVYTSAELEKYLKKHHDCDVMSSHLNDIVSTLEMEICARGFIFLRTSTSTWSENVELSRKFCKRQETHPELDGNLV